MHNGIIVRKGLKTLGFKPFLCKKYCTRCTKTEKKFGIYDSDESIDFVGRIVVE